MLEFDIICIKPRKDLMNNPDAMTQLGGNCVMQVSGKYSHEGKEYSFSELFACKEYQLPSKGYAIFLQNWKRRNHFD